MREFLRKVPAARWLVKRARLLSFTDSRTYWEKRYERGGDSGRGSYGAYACYKADVLNRFVRERNIASVIEFGCGDGAQLSLAEYEQYIGLDVAPNAIDRCKRRFSKDRSKSFFLYDPFRFVDNGAHLRADMSLSLDVIYHLVEDDVYEAYMTHVMEAAHRFVGIFSTNVEGRPDAHVRHRRFTDWIQRNYGKRWELVAELDPHISEASFFFFARADV